MRKTIAILVIVTLLGIVAAYEVPAGGKKITASTATPATASQTTTSTSQASTSTPPTTSTTASATYKDGTYTGSTASNMYEDIQVAVTISGGKITNVTTPVVNSDSGHSEQINNYAIPQLNQQVVSSQSAQIDGVSGASYTTQSYTQSLQAAHDQAKA
jgi:uncharacterized protein with FMN-binding domain